MAASFIHSHKVQTTQDTEIIEILDDTAQDLEATAISSELPAINESSHSITGIDNSSQPRLSFQRSLSANGGTRHDPIVLLDSSPIKSNPKAGIDLTKPTYAIFAPRRQHSTATQSKTQKPRIADGSWETPFPNAESQHIRGTQNHVPSKPLNLRRRVGISDNSEPHLPSDLAFLRARSPPHSTEEASAHDPVCGRHEDFDALLEEHVRHHAAIAHVLQSGRASSYPPSSQETWCDKWRPRRAEHVLGNEKEATYLREWLSALELQLQPGEPPEPISATVLNSSAVKEVVDSRRKQAKRPRPQVVRTVEKQRRRKKQRLDSDDEDHWIVDDDYAMVEAQSTEAEEEELNIGSPKRLSRLRRIQSSPAPSPETCPSPTLDKIPPHANTLSFSEDLHNTILLAGPVGSGKTAAVYACANELGWDVFEVHPGTGKRSGVCIEQLIGEVGKNHMVGKASKAKAKPKEGEEKSVFMNMFAKGKGSANISQSEAIDESMKVDNIASAREDFGFVMQPEAQAVGESTTVRQSLILLEEVDILFEEDRGFWTAVINLIKDCKRPVVLTCNGACFDLSPVTIVLNALQMPALFRWQTFHCKMSSNLNPVRLRS